MHIGTYMYMCIYLYVRIKKAEHWKTDAFWFVVLEKTLESPLDNKEVKPINPKGNQWKNWCWSWSSNTLATRCKEPTHWKRPWCWERLKAKREGATEDKMVGWHHWLSGHEFEQTLESWWWTGKPGILQSMGSQGVGHDWATELNKLNRGTFSVLIMKIETI